MKKIILSTTAAMVLATTSSAFAGVEVEAGTGMWKPSLTGEVNYKGTKIDMANKKVDDTFDTDNNYVYLDINHFIPVVPNLRVEKLNYNLSTSSDFSIELKQTDIIAYWGLPFIGIATAGILEVNFGLDIKNLKGNINDDVFSNNVDFDETLPLLYLNVQVDIPAIPVELSATTKTIAYEGSSISNNEVKISVILPIPLPLIDIKFDLGYKTQDIVIDKDLVKDLDAQIKTDGIFFGISAKF